MTRTMPVAVLVCLCLCMCGETHAATTWFSDSFDSYANAALAGQGGWTGSSAVRAESTFVLSGRSIEADYKQWGVGDVSHSVSSGYGNHIIDFDIAMDVNGDSFSSNLGYVKLFGPSGVEITRVYIAHDQLKVLLAGPAPTPILDYPGHRVWHHIKLGINLSSGKIDVWVDQVQKITSAGLYNGAASIVTITVGQWDRGADFTKAEQYIDNLVCTQDTAGQPAQLVLGPYGGWEKSHVAWPCVIQDGGAYKMFYSGSGGPDVNEAAWSQWMTGMVTSTDSITWTRRTDIYEPVLYARKYLEGDLVDPQQAAGEFDSIWAIGACVVKDGSTYKAWYTGWGGESEHIGGGIDNKINYRIGYATSTDALTWSKHSGSGGAGSVLGLGTTGSADSKGAGQPCVLASPPYEGGAGGGYRMWYEGFDGATWRILYATSTDGTSWTRQGTALSPGVSGSLDALGARDPVVVERGATYELWYQGRSAAAPNYHILRATSPDGITWTKVSGEVSMGPSDPVDGDERIHIGSILAQPDNSLWVYFAKENTTTSVVTYGTISTKNYYIYRQVMNP